MDDDARVAAGFERLYDVLRKLTPREELSLTAASTLRRLEDGPRRLTDLHAAEGVTQPAMTQLVTRLERDGLVERSGDPSDGRVVVVSVTDTGRKAVRRRREARAGALAELLRQLPPEEHAAIVAALPALEHLSDLPNT